MSNKLSLRISKKSKALEDPGDGQQTTLELSLMTSNDTNALHTSAHTTSHTPRARKDMTRVQSGCASVTLVVQYYRQSHGSVTLPCCWGIRWNKQPPGSRVSGL